MLEMGYWCCDNTKCSAQARPNSSWLQARQMVGIGTKDLKSYSLYFCSYDCRKAFEERQKTHPLGIVEYN